MNKKAENYPIIEEIFVGWAARGDGWAIHASTKEEAMTKYNERKRYYEWLDTQPLNYTKMHNGKNAELKIR